MTETRAETIDKLNLMIKDIKTAMITTHEAGVLRARPIAAPCAPFDGTLRFFTSRLTHRAEELAADDRVSVTFAAPDDNRYVAMAGAGALVDDRELMRRLWHPSCLAWFPKGPEDPNLALLCVTVEQAEYWDAISSSLVEAFGLLKALVTGERVGGSAHVLLSL